MNTIAIKKVASLLLLSTLLFSFRPIQMVQTDFSGTWKLNEGKSELGQFGARAAASKIVIDQKPDMVSFARTGTNFQGEEATTSETMTYDGKETESLVFGAAKKKAKFSWSADGQQMLIVASIAFEREGQSFDISTKEIWSLSADGKSLTIASTINSPQGEMSTKAVYEK